MKQSKFEKLLGESAVIVVIIPAIIYCLDFIFEIAYYGYYNIPASIVRVDSRTIAALSVVVLFFFFFVMLIDYWFSNQILLHFFKHYDGYDKMWVDQYMNYIFFFLTGLAIPICLLFRPIPLFFLITLISLVVIIVLMFIIEHVRFRKKQKKNTLDKDKYSIIEGEGKQFRGIMETLFGQRTFGFVIVFVFLCSFAFPLGTYMASKNKSFYEIEGRTDVIGISIFDDLIVAKELADPNLEKTYLIAIKDGTVISEIHSEEFYSLVSIFHESK